MLARGRYTREEKILLLSGITPDIFRNKNIIFPKWLYDHGKLSSKDWGKVEDADL